MKNVTIYRNLQDRSDSHYRCPWFEFILYLVPQWQAGMYDLSPCIWSTKFIVYVLYQLNVSNPKHTSEKFYTCPHTAEHSQNTSTQFIQHLWRRNKDPPTPFSCHLPLTFTYTPRFPKVSMSTKDNKMTCVQEAFTQSWNMIVRSDRSCYINETIPKSNEI